jgi:hypothetical protein
MPLPVDAGSNTDAVEYGAELDDAVDTSVTDDAGLSDTGDAEPSFDDSNVDAGTEGQQDTSSEDAAWNFGTQSSVQRAEKS